MYGNGKRKALGVLAVLFSAILCFLVSVGASTGGGVPQEVRVPISLEIPYAIAGVEFVIEYTAGLKLVSFETFETIET